MINQSVSPIGRVMVVDDEPQNRELLRDLLHAHGHSVIEAQDGQEALQRIREAVPDVVLLDVMMPCIDGFQVCRKLKNDPATAAIPVLLVTSITDRDSRLVGMEAGANDFLSKPIDREDLLLRVRNAVLTKRLFDQLQESNQRLEGLMIAEKELLEKTLTGSIKILTEVLGLVNPAAFSRTQSVTRYVKHVVSELRLPDAWRFETAAMLSQLGCVTVHPETMEAIFAGQPVSQDDQTRFARHPIVARQLLEGIPRLEYVAALIGLQAERVPAGHAAGLTNEEDSIWFGAHILKACLEFDRCIRVGMSPQAAMAKLQKASLYHASILESLFRVPVELLPFELRQVTVDDLGLNMILDQDVSTTTGVLLIARGTRITEPLLLRLQSYHARGTVQAEIRVLVTH